MLAMVIYFDSLSLIGMLLTTAQPQTTLGCPDIGYRYNRLTLICILYFGSETVQTLK